MKNHLYWQTKRPLLVGDIPGSAGADAARPPLVRPPGNWLWRTGGLAVAILCIANAAHSAVFTSVGGSVSPGGSVSVPITVSDFNDVTSFQFTLQWDSNVLQYSSTGNYGLAGLVGGSFGYLAPNRLTVGWDDPNAVGVTVPSGTTIFSVNFNAVGSPGSSSLIDFTDDPTRREVSVLFSVADFGQTAGTVEVVPEPVNLALGAFGCVLVGTAAFRRLRHKGTL